MTPETRDAHLAQYKVRPELSMLDWRAVLIGLHASGRRELADRLMEAMAEDDASPGVPAQTFGLLLEKD